MIGVPPGTTPDCVPARPVVELTTEWAAAVAEAILDSADEAGRKGLDPPVIDECWVGGDLAIYLRYRIGPDARVRIGRRIPDSHIDPTSGGYALGLPEQGFAYLHDLAAPPHGPWTDRVGYEWHGYGSPPPQPSWEDAVEGERLRTLRAPDAQAPR